jgi:hypothetical protein
MRRALSLVSNFAADLRLICYLATLEGAAAMHNKKSNETDRQILALFFPEPYVPISGILPFVPLIA